VSWLVSFNYCVTLPFCSNCVPRLACVVWLATLPFGKSWLFTYSYNEIYIIIRYSLVLSVFSGVKGEWMLQDEKKPLDTFLYEQLWATSCDATKLQLRVHWEWRKWASPFLLAQRYIAEVPSAGTPRFVVTPEAPGPAFKVELIVSAVVLQTWQGDVEGNVGSVDQTVFHRFLRVPTLAQRAPGHRKSKITCTLDVLGEIEDEKMREEEKKLTQCARRAGRSRRWKKEGRS